MKFSHSFKKTTGHHLKRRGVYLALSIAIAAAISVLFFATPLRHRPLSNTNKLNPLPVSSLEPKSPEKQLQNKNDTTSQSAVNVVFTHENIVTTVFWVGESASEDNGGISNYASAWDEDWQQRFGGVDAPTNRTGYKPANFSPQENPFYIALPYNDLNNKGTRKSQANDYLKIASVAATKYPWFKNSWIAIKHNNVVAYAQWEDVGPFEEDDTIYVFGSALPKNRQGQKAGLDVSPAVKDYLGLSDVSRTSWVFVPASQVPSGPWKETITTYPGEPVD